MRSLRSTSPAAIACSLALSGLWGCAGSLKDPQRFAYLGQADGGEAPTEPNNGGCDPIANIFPVSCATSACHSAQAQQGSLDLASGGLPQRLIGKQAHGGPGLLIDPAHPDQSVLILKLSDNPPFQFQMPLGAPPLSTDDVACLTDWVEGAVSP